MSPLPLAALEATPIAGVAWMLATAAEVPVSDDWLSTVEQAALARLRVDKRRADWRLGRWVGRRALAAALACDAGRLAIIASESGAPLALRDGLPAPVSLSLSHAGGHGLCAVAPIGVAIGCDLEPLTLREPAFVRQWFTAAEQAAIAADPTLATVFWCAKEAVLKADRCGLRDDPSRVTVDRVGAVGDWMRLATAGTGADRQAWARLRGGMVAAVVAGRLMPREVGPEILRSTTAG